MGFVLDITDSQSQPRLCAFQGLHLTFLVVAGHLSGLKSRSNRDRGGNCRLTRNQNMSTVTAPAAMRAAENLALRLRTWH